MQSGEVEISGVVLGQRAAEDRVGFAGTVHPSLDAGSIQGVNAAGTGNVKSAIFTDEGRSEGEVKRIYGSCPFQARNFAGVGRRTPRYAVPKENVCREHGNEAANKQYCQSHCFHERTMAARVSAPK